MQESIQTVYDKERKNYKSVGNVVDSYTGQTRYLVVIHSDKVNNVIRVITAMWASHGRLRYYGFEI